MGGIVGLARLEVTRNTEVDQVNMFAGANHYVGGFQVTKDNGRIKGMQEVQHGAKLGANIEHFMYRQAAAGGTFQMVLQRVSFDVIHDEIPAPTLSEVIVDTREIGVHQSG